MSNFHDRYYITKETAKDLEKLMSSKYDKKHPALEILNPKPLFVALGIKKPKSMQERLEALFRGPRGIIQQMVEQGEETPEEMNDLDIQEDIEPISPHEMHVMQEESPHLFTLKTPERSESGPADPAPGNQTAPADNATEEQRRVKPDE